MLQGAEDRVIAVMAYIFRRCLRTIERVVSEGFESAAVGKGGPYLQL